MEPIDQTSPTVSPPADTLTDVLRSLAPRSHMLNTLQLIIDTHSLVSVCDQSGRIIYANDRFCEVSKYTREELIGQTHRILKSGYHPVSFYEDMWETISSGRAWNGDIQNKSKDGSIYWVQATISPIFDEKNRIAGYGSIRTDVTAQRQQLSDLQDSKRKAYTTLNSAINILDSSMLIVDASGHIVTTNQAYSKMYPESADEEHPGSHFGRLAKKQRPNLSDAELETYVREVFTKDTTEQHVLEDGRIVKIQRRIAPGGGFVSLHTDISDIVRQTRLLESHAATVDLMKTIAVDANETSDAETAYATCLKRICDYTGWEVGHVYLPSKDGSGRCHPADYWHCAEGCDVTAFQKNTGNTVFEAGRGLPGRVFQSGEAAWVCDVISDSNFPRSLTARESGIVGGAAFPVKIKNEVVAILEFYSRQPVEPSPQLIEILSHVCAQVGRVAERDRAEKTLMTRVTAELHKRDQELVEQNKLFDAALKNMSQGLCMFDKDQRLIVSNERYAQMYDLPPQLLKPGITLRKILEYRIANGIYGGENPDDYYEERQKWVTSGVYSNKIQELSDGRSMSITHQPMADGGWLTTHEDITARRKTVKALQESQELFSKAFHLSPVPLSFSNPADGSYHDVNDAWTKVFGFSHAEATKSSALELGFWVNPNDRVAFLDKLKNDGQTAPGFETKIRTKGGEELDVVAHGEYVEVRGEVMLFMVFHDITASKRAEKERRESQELFAKAFKASPAAMAISDPNTAIILDINEAWTNMLGFSREEALNTNVHDLDIWIDPLERQKFIDVINKEGSAKAVETTLRTKDGRIIIVVSYGEKVEVGGLPRLLFVSHDITERKRSEEALRESEQRFKDIVEVSSDWIWECDENLQYTYLSERFTQVTGQPKDRFLGKSRHEISQNSGPEWKAHLADLEARRPFRAFMCNTLDDAGKMQHWMISGRPVFCANGNFKGYRGTGADRTKEVRDQAELIRHRDHLQDLVDEATTELSQRAEELRHALTKEKELNEVQRQFVSMASHEFRTPLAIIDSAAQRILRQVDKLTPQDTTKRVEKIRSAVGRMTQLMESTLEAARFEEGKINIKIGQCDLRYAILEVGMHQIEISPNHNIISDLSDLPDYIMADKGAINQIISNLVSNAVKYSPDTSDIRLKGWQEGEFAVLEVKDQGLGIDEHDLPKMFQRFFRARTSTGIAGTGIGLNLVKTLVELHEGSIAVRSKKGTGSIFTVRLPIKGPLNVKPADGQAA